MSRRGLALAVASAAWLGPRRAGARGGSGEGAGCGPGQARLAELAAASAELGAARLDSEAWRAGVEAALAGVEAAALRACVMLDWAEVRANSSARGYASRVLEPGQLRGWSDSPGARAKLFVLARGRAILPHAHRHIVSVFVVLDGAVRARHYDRVRDEPEAIVIRPSGDCELGPGASAAISERRDNVHWLSATRGPTVLLNLSVSLPPALRSEAGPSGRIYLDPEPDTAPTADGLIRAPRVSLDTLRQRHDGAAPISRGRM